MPRRAGRIHLVSMLFGAGWAVTGVLIADRLIAPVLTRGALPEDERTLASVHRTIQRNAVLAGDSAALMREGARGMLASLKDPYASWTGPEEMRASQEESSGTYVGIGAVLAPDGRVLFPMPGGPAEEAGLRVGDRIRRADDADVGTLGSEDLAPRLRGEPGSLVRLDLLRRDGTEHAVELRRRSVPSGTVGDVRWLDRSAGLAHAHLRSFAQTTAQELRAALELLEQDAPLRGLALDLRWNVGGQLDAAVGVASFFLRGQVVCTLRDQDGSARPRMADPQQSRWPDLPIALLVNGRSASGSEVLAGALRDHGAAVLVGERTYGKGIYQEVYRYLEGDFVLRFTAGEYLTPAGQALEGRLRPSQAPGGLEPDLPVPARPEFDAAVQTWLNIHWPPAALRAEVEEVFPNHFPNAPPADPALVEALALLRRAFAA
jgi:carboxyl-terminal processing protease